MTPLVLITGFLGAGKTSLLRTLLPALKQQGVMSHVILNDQGNAAVDASTLGGLADEIKAITAGCVCCESMEEMDELLEELQIQQRDMVFIESSGTTEPLPLLERLLLMRRRSRFPVVLHVNVVDCKRWGLRGEGSLERAQTRCATHVVFGWQDEAGEGRKALVRRQVSLLNPGALFLEPEQLGQKLLDLLEEDSGNVPPAFIGFDQTLLPIRPKQAFLPQGGSTVIPSLGTGTGGGFAVNPAARAKAHKLSHRFTAIQVKMPEGVLPLQLVAWLQNLPSEVVRAKGLVYFAGNREECFFFQRVEDHLSFNTLIWPPEDRLTVALLVGIDLDEAEIRGLASLFLLPAQAFTEISGQTEDPRSSQNLQLEQPQLVSSLPLS